MKLFYKNKAIKEIKEERHRKHGSGHDYDAGYFTGLCVAIRIINNNIEEKEDYIRIRKNNKMMSGIIDGKPYCEPMPNSFKIINKDKKIEEERKRFIPIWDKLLKAETSKEIIDIIKKEYRKGN